MDTILIIKEIHVTGVDNELYIIASNNSGSSEICHIKSGFHDSVNYTLYPPAILPTGEYDLIVIGINWGGPEGFCLSMTGDKEEPLILEKKETENSEPVGANWRHVVHVTVQSGGVN